MSEFYCFSNKYLIY